MAEDRKATSLLETGDLFEEWKRTKRKRPGLDEPTFERLVYHDVRALLLMEHLRSKERPE